MPNALYREIWDFNNNREAVWHPELPDLKEGDNLSGAPDVDDVFNYLADTYNFYLTRHGRDSRDGLGMKLRAIVRYCNRNFMETCPLENAFGGDPMDFGDEWTSDDIVAHEYTHMVTGTDSDRWLGAFESFRAGSGRDVAHGGQRHRADGTLNADGSGECVARSA